MSEEPRRKRKWDNQGEDDAATKKAASEASIHSKDENGVAGTATAPNGTSFQSNADEAAAAAAIAAARINAMLVAQGKAPTETESTNATVAKPQEHPHPMTDAETAGGSAHNNGAPFKESKERDEFVADIDINDVKHRYILTKGSVQTQLHRDTGADVTTRGKFYQDRSMATEKEPPLYLHVTALTQEELDNAVQKINELIEEAQNPPPLPPQRDSFQPGSRGFGGPPPRHQSFHARVAIGIDSDRMFNVRAKIVGPGGQYVKHVQNVTRTRVQLKGQGSGYLEVDTGRESDEPLYINILGNNQEEVDEAERLCKDLVETVRGEYEKMKSRPPMHQEPYGHNRTYSDRSSYYNGGQYGRYQGGHQQYHNQPPNHQYGYNQHYQAPPPPPGTTPSTANPPLPPGPPPPPAEQLASAAPTTTAAAVPATSAAADAAAQGYTYEQYEAYNQYYQQQQYYQQYSQYYQQAYAHPGAEQDPSTLAAGAPVSSDPALAYYGYAYAPPPVAAESAVGAPTSTAETGAAPPPPPPPADGSDSQPAPPKVE